MEGNNVKHTAGFYHFHDFNDSLLPRDIIHANSRDVGNFRVAQVDLIILKNEIPLLLVGIIIHGFFLHVTLLAFPSSESSAEKRLPSHKLMMYIRIIVII